MQSTRRLHDGIASAVLHDAYLVFHNPVSFYSNNCVFDTHADGRDHAILRFLRWGEFTPRWLVLRLNDRDLVQHKALESLIVIEVTPAWEAITRQLRQAFVLFLAFNGVTQAADVTGLLDDQQVVDRVALLLAAVVVLLVFGIDWAMDRSLSAIMPTRRGFGTPSVRVAASITVTSSAFRAGRSS
jgi:hypothetical protein